MEQIKINGEPYYVSVWGKLEYIAKYKASAGGWFVGARHKHRGELLGEPLFYRNIGDCKAFVTLPSLLKLKVFS